MNSQTHRVIFNKSRGCMMAVSEVASGQGKGKSRKSSVKRCKKPVSTVLNDSMPNSSHFYSSNTGVAHVSVALPASKSIANYFQHAKAATVDAQGSLSAIAKRDINLTEGQQSSSVAYAMRTTSSGLFSSSSTQLRTSQDSTQAIGTSLGGNTVTLNAGRDINVRASSVIGETATTAVAGNNINLTAGQNTNAQTYSYEKKESGLLSGGGLGISIGRREQSNANQGQGTTAAASTIGAINGNVNLIAGNQYRQVGSDVQAPNGDVNIIARQVDIVEARQTNASQSETKFKQSGLTVSLAGGVISAVQGIEQMAGNIGNTSSTRAKALGAAVIAGKANQALDAVTAGQGTTINGVPGQIVTSRNADGSAATGVAANAADQAGGLSLNISLGSSRSQSNSSGQSDTARGSSVAGNNVSIIATGGAGPGTESNLTIQGSSITAKNNALLAADNNLNVVAAANTDSSASSNSAKSGSIGASIGLGSAGGLSFNASTSKAQGNGQGQGQGTSYTNSAITAGNTATLQSGGNTTIAGAVVAANRIQADVAGNLSIQSLQDTNTYSERQSSSSASISISPTGIPTGGSISAAKSDINSNFQSTGEQSGIKAGDGGFQVNVGGNTDLKGAVIASTQAAVYASKNSFSTAGNLTTTDLQNTAAYKATASGYTIGIGTELLKSGGGVGSNQASAASTASAGISGIAGNKAVRSTDANTAITPIFDQNKVKADVTAQVAIMTSFGQQAVPVAASYSDRKAIELRRAGNEAEAKKWDEGGAYRTVLYAGLGGLTGGLGGATGAAASSVVVPSIGEEIAKLNLPEPIRQGLTTIMGTAVGALAGGAAGAATAVPLTAFNYVSHSPFANVRVAVSQENAKLSNACGTNCTVADFRRIDLLMNKLETAGTLTEIGKNSKLTTEQAITLGENVAALLPVYGTPIALYQAISAESLSGSTLSNAERFFNGVAAAVPLASTAYRIVTSAATDMTKAAALSNASAGSTILGHNPAYVSLATNSGGNYFSVPNGIWNAMTPVEQWAANQKFLDRMISSGSDIVLATPLTQVRTGSWFERELVYLASKGYVPSPDGARLIKR